MATQPIIERKNSSGEISVKGKLMKWHKTNGGTVSIDLEQVAVIGEYTTDIGLFADDWFLVFVCKNGEWEEVSVYAEGFQEMARLLSELFGIDFSRPFLVNSAEWKSFLRYPKHLEGKELFVLTPPKGYKPATTVFQNFKLALGMGVYGKDWNIELTYEVKAEVGKASG